MDLHEPFIRLIAESLYDDTPRLIYADWLEEHGDLKRAEFIRVQCELEPIRDQYEIARAAELHRREEKLLQENQQKWLGPELEGWGRWREDGASAVFRRGFVDTISMPVRTFLDLGANARWRHPTIRRVVLFRLNGYGHRIAQCVALEGLAELELACWYSNEDAEVIASSPYLGQLQVLELWLGRQGEPDDAVLCQVMANSKAWSRLRELTLLNPDGESEENRKRLATVANQSAGREVAVYQRGYPELFPFAADYWYTFPGYLPDGRMAMASEDHKTSPPSLCVITFDEKGTQTDDVLTVPMPADLLMVPVDKWYEHKDRMRQQLVETIGFRPGFIRIRGCQFPWDEWGGYSPNRGHEKYWEEQLGFPDKDDEASWKEYPCGIGGQISWLMRGGEYVFGWDWWANKEGFVHST